MFYFSDAMSFLEALILSYSISSVAILLSFPIPSLLKRTSSVADATKLYPWPVTTDAFLLERGPLSIYYAKLCAFFDVATPAAKALLTGRASLFLLGVPRPFA